MTPLPTPRNKTQFLIQFVRTNPPMRKKDLLEKTAVLLNSTKYRMASLLWNTLGVKGPLEELEDTTIVPMEQSALLRGARANQ